MVATQALTPLENDTAAQADLALMFADQPPLEAPVDLYGAMARAVSYNLDARVRAMELALAQDRVDLAKLDMLPRVHESIGVEGRSNVSASSSRSIVTGRESLEPSTSLDDERVRGDLRLVWNILDFGVSYHAANQASDRAKIARERQRKVVHDIVQDVRGAYWRAVTAERLLSRIDPLMRRVERALADSARIEQLRLNSPVEALEYQRGLLSALRQLQGLRRDLTLAKTELAALMNLPPSTHYRVAIPRRYRYDDIRVDLTPGEIERIALAYRPELIEERYQERIGQAETRKAVLRMLPGIDLETSINYDDNSFLVNNSWAGYGAFITGELMELVRGPADIRAAEASEAVIEARRLAAAMAVLVQAHVAWINYRNAREDYRTAVRARSVERRMVEQLRARGAAETTGDLSLIRAEFELLLADLRRDLSYGALHNASGAILYSMGADPLPASVAVGSLDELADLMRERERAWLSGAVGLNEFGTTIVALN